MKPTLVLLTLSVLVLNLTSARADTVSFAGSFMGAAAPPAPGRCSAPALTVVITDAPGMIAPFGAASTTQSHCVNPPSLDFTDGIFTFTFANGGSFSGTYSGTLVPTAPPVFAIKGTFTITGGTGSFAGATGGGTASGTQNFANGEFSLQLNGSVTAPNLCQVCHKRTITLVVPCDSMEYRRHLDHGDPPQACVGSGR
jgi:hypothetical protein